MITISELQKVVEERLIKEDFITTPKGLYDPIEYIMSLGGKRIRPTLCLAGCYLFNDNYEQALTTGLGLEVFHNFTLLHDDVMDNADVRRNKPTVHCKWDENTAILSGDAMMIKAYQYISRVDQNILKPILDLFNQTAIEVCEGQQYDMEFETRDNVTIDEYLEMIRLKTAVLLAGSLKAGAIIGMASETDAINLYEFGQNIGLAFQLQDDFLDVYGDEKTFGKAIGGDILANKKTFLLITALERASGTLADELQKWIKIPSFNREEKINAVTDIYSKLEVDKTARDKMNEYFQMALSSLEKVNGRETMKSELRNFAIKLIERSR
nr:polyprenyl synthetase family protein [uncultured Carboxylicivirga sp.]